MQSPVVRFGIACSWPLATQRELRCGTADLSFNETLISNWEGLRLDSASGPSSSSPGIAKFLVGETSGGEDKVVC